MVWTISSPAEKLLFSVRPPFSLCTFPTFDFSKAGLGSGLPSAFRRLGFPEFDGFYRIVSGNPKEGPLWKLAFARFVHRLWEENKGNFALEPANFLLPIIKPSIMPQSRTVA
ncbi:MAG: hypothetical protein KY445_08955 [Armatimonadetes bacterium]|nr:hypothetical protein [Armatimonadota bacterium]